MGVAIFFVPVNNPSPCGDVNIYVNKKSLFLYDMMTWVTPPAGDVNIFRGCGKVFFY